MKKLNLICIFISGMLFSSMAQTPVKFRKVIGNSGYDYGYSAQQTPDKGYVLLGSTSSFAGSSDMYAIKTDSMGIPYMHKSFGGINIEKGYSVRRTNDNGYILLGYTNSFGAGGYDIYMVKTDSAFSTQWEKTYGGADWDFGNCVRQTSDGGYIICGSTYSYGNGSEDYYLLKTDSNGDTTWTKTFGGSNDDVAKSVVQTSDGGYALTGYTKSMGDVNGDFYTIKTNAAGDTVWTNKYGGAQADLGNSIIESMSGNYVIAGEATTSGNTDGIVVVLSSAGIYQNNYVFPSGPAYDNFNYISEDSQGKFAMVGNTNSLGLNGDLQFVILRSDLSYYNSTTFGTNQSDFGYSVEPTADKGFILCGHTNGFNNGLDDIYLIKTDTLGLSGSSGSETFFVTGISEMADQEKNDLLFYPNPANSKVMVKIENGTPGEETIISVIDLPGREVIRIKTAAPSYEIDLRSISDGMYLIKAENEKGIFSGRLIVHH